MSIRLEMLQVARLAPRLLSDATALVQDFVLSKMAPEGGFCDRADKPDLYYAVFGLESLNALQAEIPKDTAADYLTRFGDGADLDLIHQCALARCWRALGSVPAPVVAALLATLARHAAPDGGFNTERNPQFGTVYGTFMALGAYQDCGQNLPEPDATRVFIQSLRLPDGGYADRAELNWGTVPTTAGAVTVLRHLDASPAIESADWLLGHWHQAGGFLALKGAVMPDLLSTAVTLHALSSFKHSLDPLREPCLDFIDSLWVNKGAFHGCWADDFLDLEYTFYGLLALGHLYL